MGEVRYWRAPWQGRRFQWCKSHPANRSSRKQPVIPDVSAQYLPTFTPLIGPTRRNILRPPGQTFQ
jgi:hypothetical protein